MSYRSFAVLLPLILLAAAVPACDAPDRASARPDAGADRADLVRIAQETLEWNRVEANADTLLDEIGARVSATPSGSRARSFIRGRLESYGLDQVWQDPFGLLAWDRRDATLEIVQPDTAADGGEITVLSLGHVGSHDLEAPLVDAGYGTDVEIEALGERVSGAIVLADVGSPDGYGRSVHRTEKVSLATRAGASGFIQLNTAEGPLIPVGVATMGDEATEIPAVAADRATGERLRDALAAHDEVVVRLSVDNWMERSSSANVMAEIEGRSDEIVLVGAHLDSWDLATGAIDNGSGSLAVLEIARALSAHVRETGERPWRSIRFAFWMGEELGLYGSRHYVDSRLEEGELGRHRAILNLDVVGTPVGLGAIGRPEAGPFLEGVRGALLEAGFELDGEITTGGGIYSDHQPFLMAGVPVLVVRSRQRPEASGVGHTTADLREVLDEPGIARSAAVSAAVLWAVANEPEPDLPHWSHAETGAALEALGVRDPLERSGDWRWN